MTEHDKPQPENYAAARPFLKASFEHLIAAGHNARDMVEFSLERFGDAALPYLRRFLAEVHAGEVKIKGLTKTAKTKVFGTHLTAGEREQRIRDAAYFRALRRGFVGGSPEEDWCEAEREVDAQLARETGLIERGRRALESVATLAEREIDQAGDLVSDWLQRQGAALKQRTGKKAGEKEGAAAAKKAVKAAKAPAKKAAGTAAKPKTAQAGTAKPKIAKGQATAQRKAPKPAAKKPKAD